jgi:hypothetical protein
MYVPISQSNFVFTSSQVFHFHTNSDWIRSMKFGMAFVMTMYHFLGNLPLLDPKKELQKDPEELPELRPVVERPLPVPENPGKELKLVLAK